MKQKSLCFRILCPFILLLPLFSLFGKEPLRLYSTLSDPTEHPDYLRKPLTPPSWETFKNQTQLICQHNFPLTDGRGGDFAQSYAICDQNGLGKIIWPHIESIYMDNLDEFARFVKENDYYLFSPWGYVPGSGEFGDGAWVQYQPNPEKFRILEDILQDRWLGMENGEQDGRYIGGYAPAFPYTTRDRFSQFLYFERHFEKMGDDLGNRLSTLVSLNFGHYFLKDGNHTLIGAETAQALPNSQVYYSWIRGAGKEYGRLWYGNVSIYNRWGSKNFPSHPEDGTSTSLMKRLMYSHILYNCAAIGFETNLLADEELTPIGEIQREAGKWIEQNGFPGVMLTPIALMSDFYSGWTFPQHLYEGYKYRVWVNLPYEAGDYLQNNLYSILYPGYEDASYYHDERGFFTETPYGDGTDTLLTDAPLWLLEQYPLLVIADQISGGEELRDKLTDYTSNGGRLVLTAGNLSAFPNGLLNLSVGDKALSFPAGTKVEMENGETIEESMPFDLLPLTLPPEAKVLAKVGETPVAAEVPYGKGSVLVLASAFGLSSKPLFCRPLERDTVDTPLPNPYPLLNHARTLFQNEFDRTVLFDAGEGLATIVCRRGEGKYLLGVFNNSLTEKSLNIRSRIGTIETIRETQIASSEKEAEGYLPKGMEKTSLGNNSDTTIAGGDLRIFEIRLNKETIEIIPPSAPKSAPQGRYLTILSNRELKEEILARPTFLEHYDGVLIDWRYLQCRSMEQLQHESGWLHRQGLRIAVDLTSGVNLYPDLRLIPNDKKEYARSLKTFEELIEKSAAFGVSDLILSFHRLPENNFSEEDAINGAAQTLKKLARDAREKNIRLSVRFAPKDPGDARSFNKSMEILNRIEGEEIFLVPHLSLFNGTISPEESQKLADRFSFIAIADAPIDPFNGDAWSGVIPISRRGDTESLQPLKNFPKSILLFDAVYEDQDEEYRDRKLVEQNL